MLRGQRGQDQWLHYSRWLQRPSEYQGEAGTRRPPFSLRPLQHPQNGSLTAGKMSRYQPAHPGLCVCLLCILVDSPVCTPCPGPTLTGSPGLLWLSFQNCRGLCLWRSTDMEYQGCDGEGEHLPQLGSPGEVKHGAQTSVRCLQSFQSCTNQTSIRLQGAL